MATSVKSSEMISKDKICAVIVTWNTEEELERGLAATSPQVDEIVIVDNGSGPESIAVIEQLSKKFNATLIRNSENLGIAAALNRGVKYAIKKGYDWILTLDDDSAPEPEMVSKMLEAYYSFDEKERDKIGIIAPNYTTPKGLVCSRKVPYVVPVAITSGQLVKTDIFSKTDFYKDNLFIECVDHEFCLRLLRFGFKTIFVPGAILKHRGGTNPILKNILGKRIVMANHVPSRYYYMYRNNIYLYKNYLMTAPLWIARSIFFQVYLCLKVVLFEEERLKKILMMLRGCFDGIRGRYGKFNE